eukprot:5401754-Amphidinium_carterae.1
MVQCSGCTKSPCNACPHRNVSSMVKITVKTTCAENIGTTKNCTPPTTKPFKPEIPSTAWFSLQELGNTFKSGPASCCWCRHQWTTLIVSVGSSDLWGVLPTGCCMSHAPQACVCSHPPDAQDDSLHTVRHSPQRWS